MANQVKNQIKFKSKTKKEMIKLIHSSFNNEGKFDFELYKFSRKPNATNTQIINPCIDTYCTINSINKNNFKINYLSDKEISSLLQKEKSFYVFEITFYTFWSLPEEVIDKISKSFPSITLEVQWADEDIGFNCGWYSIKNERKWNLKFAPTISVLANDVKQRWFWLNFAHYFKYNKHPAYSGYDLDGNYNENIEKNPESYLKNVHVSNIIENF